MIPKLVLAALVSVLVAVGVAVSALGWVALAAYLVLVVAAIALAVRRTRPADDGRTCTCCTSTVFDPVEVK